MQESGLGRLKTEKILQSVPESYVEYGFYF